MTRGTIFTILPNDKMICSIEFNGDMYGSTKDDLDSRAGGKYKEVIRHLVSVIDENTFKKEVNEFNKSNHDYGDQIIFDEDVEHYKNFDGSYRAGQCSSDYSFWKNCSGDKIEIVDKDGVDVELDDGEIATFNYGRYIEGFDVNKESWEDMFKRFEII